MSAELEKRDILDDFQDFYSEEKGKIYASNSVEGIRRGIEEFNEGLKAYLEQYPNTSTVDMNDLNNLKPDDDYIASNSGLKPYIDFLNFASDDEMLNDGFIGDKYNIVDKDKIKQDRNPIDKLIDKIELREPISVEADLAEYVVADLSRETDQPPQKTEVKQEMEGVLGYELTHAQVENRVTRKGRITEIAVKDQLENSFSLEE